MSFRYEIRLSGAGGQGLILIGKILAEAAAIFADLNATQSQSYGPESRGGASRSEVIISDEDIDYPKAGNVDFLLAMTQEAFDKYGEMTKNGGIVVYDMEMVHTPRQLEGVRVFPAQITELAIKEFSKPIVANMVALGIVINLSNILGIETVKEAIKSRVPKGTEEINLKAFDLGYEKGKELQGL
ncbi:2-oxoacid:acceptor oxidoreductase family protein [candidate division WOR-3 bacterium]|nr:2-oxoacid:acceptor oxidoreductase family protein [candidate division WOR-3 bacterium]